MGSNSSNPDLLPGTLYMMVLRTLSKGPLHGYAIAKHIHNWSKGGLEIEDGYFAFLFFISFGLVLFLTLRASRGMM